jgi:hypothetical protein
MSLKIFISHKMPTDSIAAKTVGDLIAAASGPEITVINAAQFRYGTDFRSKIRSELETTDIFILLYTGDDADWSYCLWECGNFESFINNTNNKSIIVMHDPKIDPPKVLQIYKSLPTTSEEIWSFLKNIYVTEWKAFPNVNQSMLERNARDIAGAFIKRDILNFDLVPNFSIRITLSEQNLCSLQSNAIPPDSYVSGSLSWQRLFGKVNDTGGWSWGELTKEWRYKDLYEYEFSRMIAVALNKEGPEGCLLRDSLKNLFYVTLRRYESDVVHRYANFMFSAFRIETPIYSVKGLATPEEVISYNVLNMCWYVRRRLIDELYPNLLQLLLIKNGSGSDNDVKVLQRVRNELNSISVQSEIRELGQLVENKKVFNNDIRRLVNDSNLWNKIKISIKNEGTSAHPDLAVVAHTLYDVAKLNLKYYQETASKFATLAAGLSLPDPADEYIKLAEEAGRQADNSQ